MKSLLGIVTAAFLLTSCAADHLKLNANLSRVDENHYETVIDNNTIILDSYIMLFQRPYYIVLKSEKPLSREVAEKIAVEYIQPRGCTSPVQRRTDLDKNNQAQTQWLIGVEC